MAADSAGATTYTVMSFPEKGKSEFQKRKERKGKDAKLTLQEQNISKGV